MSGLAGLRRIEPVEVRQRSMLLAALNGVHASEAVLRASLPPDIPEGLCWFLCDNGSRFALDLWAGAPVHLQAGDGVEAAELLREAEPLIAAVEHSLGLELEPAELGRQAPPTGQLLVWVEGLKDGQAAHSLLVAVPPDCELRPVPAPFAPELVGRVAVEVDLLIDGPRLSPHEAADLGRGDLLLLGPSDLSAMLHLGWRAPIAGSFDPRSRTFRSLA